MKGINRLVSLGALLLFTACSFTMDLLPPNAGGRLSVFTAAASLSEADMVIAVRANRSRTAKARGAVGTLSYALAGGEMETEGPQAIALNSGRNPDPLRSGFVKGYADGGRIFDPALLPPGPPPVRTEQSRKNSPPLLAEVGSTWQFWVSENPWKQVSCTLRAVGEKSKVWIADENFSFEDGTDRDNILGPVQARALAERFDDIYRYETAIFGYEFGAEDGSGGMDGDSRVNIFLYDIDADYEPDAVHGVAGYFWEVDERSQEELDTIYGSETYHSNEAELFYLDVHFVDRFPSAGFSTLVHEFQHMIHYNEKVLKRRVRSSTWYNEMLSMLAEDVVCPLIGVPLSDSEHPVSARFPCFTEEYADVGVGEWLAGEHILASYAVNFAFGACLLRNYGGAALLREIAHNKDADYGSITSALHALGYNDSFHEAFARYTTSLLREGFDHTVSSKIGGTVYRVYGFRINDVAAAPVLYSPGFRSMGAYSFLLQQLPLASVIPAKATVTLTQENNWFVKTGPDIPPITLDLEVVKKF